MIPTPPTPPGTEGTEPMAGVQIKSFEQPDEVYEFDDGRSRGEFVTMTMPRWCAPAWLRAELG